MLHKKKELHNCPNQIMQKSGQNIVFNDLTKCPAHLNLNLQSVNYKISEITQKGNNFSSAEINVTLIFDWSDCFDLFM